MNSSPHEVASQKHSPKDLRLHSKLRLFDGHRITLSELPHTALGMPFGGFTRSFRERVPTTVHLPAAACTATAKKAISSDDTVA